MTIAEVARTFDLTPDTLRYYEKIGLIPPVARSRGGVRRYSDADCRWIDFLSAMRLAGVPLDALTAYARETRFGDEAAAQEERDGLLRAEFLQGRQQKIAAVAVVRGELFRIVLRVGEVAASASRDH